MNVGQKALAAKEEGNAKRKKKRLGALDRPWTSLATEDIIKLWNDEAVCATGHNRYCVGGYRNREAKLIRYRLEDMARQEEINPPEFLPEFFKFVLTQWLSFREAPATQWMVRKNILPRTPDLRFVIHHWAVFVKAMQDHTPQLAAAANPEAAELRQELQQLRHTAKRPGGDASMRRLVDSLREEVRQLKQDNAKLRSQLGRYQASDPDFLKD